MLLLSSADFSKLTPSNYFLRNTIRVSYSMDPDQNGHFVHPYLGPNCLQRLSARKQVTACKERITHFLVVDTYGPVHETLIFIAYL